MIFSRIKQGLSKTSASITEGISGIFTKKKLDQEALDNLEDLLISADLGPKVASEVIAEFSSSRFEKEIAEDEIKKSLAEVITKTLRKSEKSLTVDISKKPFVILVVGVNGSGKTTTIGKLALKFKEEGKSLALAACDTFRAAAVDQLKVWAERSGIPIITGEHNQDPASVAFKAIEQATAEKKDILIIDTAGRLQNKTGLMDELAKINRVIQKADPTAPHETLLVLDATTGQNAISQVEGFKQITPLTGLIVTKLDGTAKGGVVVALAEKSQLPVYMLGVGEQIADLQEFSAENFAKALVGI